MLFKKILLGALGISLFFVLNIGCGEMRNENTRMHFGVQLSNNTTGVVKVVSTTLNSGCPDTKVYRWLQRPRSGSYIGEGSNWYIIFLPGQFHCIITVTATLAVYRVHTPDPIDTCFLKFNNGLQQTFAGISLSCQNGLLSLGNVINTNQSSYSNDYPQWTATLQYGNNHSGN